MTKHKNSLKHTKKTTKKLIPSLKKQKKKLKLKPKPEQNFSSKMKRRSKQRQPQQTSGEKNSATQITRKLPRESTNKKRY